MSFRIVFSQNVFNEGQIILDPYPFDRGEYVVLFMPFVIFLLRFPVNDYTV